MSYSGNFAKARHDSLAAPILQHTRVAQMLTATAPQCFISHLSTSPPQQGLFTQSLYFTVWGQTSVRHQIINRNLAKKVL